MTLSIHASAVASYDEADDVYERIAGVSAGASTTLIGQSILRGLNRAVQKIIDTLGARGFTVAQIATIGAIKEKQLDGAVCFWGRDPAFRFDPGRLEVIERYCADFADWLESASFFTAAGVYVDPSETAAGATGLQAKASVRNNSASDQHLFEFDSSQLQFAPGHASRIAADTKYPNPS